MALEVINWLLMRIGDALQWLWHDALGTLLRGATHLGHALDPILSPVAARLSGLADLVLGPPLGWLQVLPGWLSSGLISSVIGLLLLMAFKYTSNQPAIARTRDAIQANLLALRLFKDEFLVTMRCQGRLVIEALRLLRHSLRPLALMALPVTLVYAQMASWYEWRPLKAGEDALVTVELSEGQEETMSAIELKAESPLQVVIGPVRIPSRDEVWWKIRPLQAGEHILRFRAGELMAEKTLVVGEQPRRISPQRPDRNWSSILLYPLERPFSTDSAVQSIRIHYPPREGWAGGAGGWLLYSVMISMAAALVLKPFLRVRL